MLPVLVYVGRVNLNPLICVSYSIKDDAGAQLTGGCKYPCVLTQLFPELIVGFFFSAFLMLYIH